MTGHRTCVALAAAAVVASTLVPAPGAEPGSGALTPSNPVVRWSGGPLNGSAPDPAQCTPVSCDEFALVVEVPRSYWRRAPGGVVVRIEWGDPSNDLALVIFDGEGRQVAGSSNTNQYGGRSAQMFLAAPLPGPYRVLVQGFAALNATYRGEAYIVEQRTAQARSAPNTMRFSPTTLVDAQVLAPEPGVWVDRKGTVFVTAIWIGPSTGLVWRSDDDGRTFRLLDHDFADNLASPVHGPCATSGTGGADTALTTDRTGRVYLVDLEPPRIMTGFSTDGGETWTCNHLGATTVEVDRPWIAASPTADGEGGNVDAYLAYKDLVVGQIPGGRLVKPNQIHVDVTTDGGRTWNPAGTPTFARGLVVQVGPIFTAADGTVYQVFEGNDASIWMARSTDQGGSFTMKRVSQRLGPPGHVFVAGDVDRGGNVFAAWVDAGTYSVLYSYSTDQGDHWSTPVRVSPPGSTAVMPWVATGRNGDVAIAWYGTSGSFRPQLAPASAAWRPWVARSLNGASASPRFEIAPMSVSPVRRGPICMGSACADNDRFADFFAIAIAPDGAVLGAFNDDVRDWEASPPDGSSSPQPYVEFARQVSGLGMRGAVARAASETDADARYPSASPNGRQVRELDFASMPTAKWSSGKVELAFTLASASDLTRALEVAGSVVTTDAYWLVVWKARGRVEYAGMHIDRSGAPDFFGGDRPVGVVRHLTGEVYASYPPEFPPLNGNVDAATGRVSIELPPALYTLKPGDTLTSFQAFSMTGLLQERTVFNMLQAIDSTPAQSMRLQVPGLSAAPPTVHPPRVLPGTGVGEAPFALPALAVAAALAGWLKRAGRWTGWSTRRMR